MGHVGNRSQIAPEVPQLLANPLSEFRLLGLSGFGDPQIRSSGVLPIGAGLRLRARATDVQTIDDRFRFLSGVIEEVQVRRIFDISRHAGGIEEELAFRGRGLVFSLCVDPFFVWLFVACRLSVGEQPGNGFIDGS